MKKIFIVILTGGILAACSGESSETKEQELLKEMNKDTLSFAVPQDVLDEMMQTLPSPIEIANIITKSKGEFNKGLLIPSANAGKFKEKYAQALALGAYGVDLGYINMNNRTLYVIEYLESLRDVAKELKVEQFFDFTTLSKLAKSKNNVDSLIHVSTQNFNNIDRCLRSQKRGDLSVLLLIGAWIEGLHMFNEIAISNPGEDINNRIGEQKIIIDNIYAILSKLDKIQYYVEFSAKLKNLKNAFDQVQISYEYHPPTMKDVNGQLVVEDNTKTILKITNEDLKRIADEVKKLRNDLLIK